mgnify:CR=1 FL=1
MSMNNWTPRHMRTSKGSQTRGKDKQPSCQADVFKKFMAKSAKSYKSKEYGSWCRMVDLMNGIKR